MDKVWIVTSGEYSDYGIEAVFSSEEEADRFIKGQKYSDRFESVEWSLMNLDEYEVKTVYSCSITLRSGEIYDHDDRDEWIQKNKRSQVEKYDASTENAERRSGWKHLGAVSYVSRDHAHKLAVELRQHWIREFQF